MSGCGQCSWMRALSDVLWAGDIDCRWEASSSATSVDRVVRAASIPILVPGMSGKTRTRRRQCEAVKPARRVDLRQSES